MKKEYKSFAFDLKQFDEDDKFFRFEGFASTFGNTDLVDDIVERGAFSESLKRQAQVPILWQHNMGEPIGRSVILEERDQGLFVSAVLPKKDTLVNGRVIPQMEIGSIKEMSIGFFIKRFEIDEDREIRILKEIDLFEISLVTKAANPMALINDFKSLKSLKDVEKVLKEFGFSNTKSRALISKIKEFSSQREAGDPIQCDVESNFNYLKQINQILEIKQL